MSSFIGTKPHQVPTNGDLGRLAYLDYTGVDDIGTYVPTIPSATSIAVSTQITFVSGTVAISNIIPPTTFINGGQITLIPTGKFTLSTSGNIAIAVSAEVSKPIYLTYEATMNKWYPSYSNTVNRITITAPPNGSTLTIADNKTLTVNKTITIDGTDNKTLTVNKNITLDGADSKTLTLNSSVTLNTTSNNAVTLDLASGGTVTFTSSKLSAFSSTTSSELAGVLSDKTGFSTTGSVVFNNGPTLIAPVLGDATATSINKVAITSVATGSTLSIADSKTLTVNKSITLDGADSKTLTVNKSITLDGTDSKTLTVNKSITLDGADSKTLTLNSSVTINTTGNNAVTLDLRTGGTVVYTNDPVGKLSGGGANQIAYQTAADTTGFIAAPTTANTVLTYNGTSLGWAGSGLTPTAIKVATGYTASANDLVRCDTTSAAFSVLLPATPLDGTILAFVDVANSFSTHNLTINPNGNKIEGSTNSMVSNVNGAYLEFTYISSATNWKMLQAPLTVSSIVATGTLSATTYLAGDGSWKSIKESTYTPTVPTTPNPALITIDFSTVNSTTIIINLPTGVTGATITFTNLSTPATAGTIFSFSVIVSHVSALSSDTAIVFRHGSNVSPKWTGNIIPPNTTTAAAIDIWAFFTYDAGTSLVGSLAMADVRNA